MWVVYCNTFSGKGTDLWQPPHHTLNRPSIHSTAILNGWMDYVTGCLMEWMEMDARAIHSTAWTKWTVDVEWIASLVEIPPLRLCRIASKSRMHNYGAP